jgi:aminoglycoside 2'-N-acetyltransferase I
VATTRIVSKTDLTDAVFDLLLTAHGGLYDQEAFWPADSFHAVVYEGHQPVGHAGVLTRKLYVAGRPIETAYVEYVSAEPKLHGYGSMAMEAIENEIRQRGFLLAGLATGSPEFYERLGWQRWRGATAYRAPDGAIVPAPDEIVMVLDLGAGVDLDAPIECDWRAVGDIW